MICRAMQEIAIKNSLALWQFLLHYFCMHNETEPFFSYYPRPVLAFGYCCCLHLYIYVHVSVCVYQSLACPHDNSGPVQARITKFGLKLQNTLVKVPIVFGSNQPWPSRSNLTLNSKFIPFWACPQDNLSPIPARITKFGPQMHLSTVKIPVVLGVGRPWPSRSNLT